MCILTRENERDRSTHLKVLDFSDFEVSGDVFPQHLRSFYFQEWLASSSERSGHTLFQREPRKGPQDVCQ